MACAHPLHIKNKYYSNKYGFYNWNRPYFDCPCGWCLNCRVDKRNAISDRCKYAFNEFGSGAFVTFTYDDAHILHLIRQDKYGNKVATLSHKDSQDMIKRLRISIQRMYKKHPKYEKNTKFHKFCNDSFKYVSTGEYGGQYGRPHIHCLFFGLDYHHCKKIFKNCWDFGIVDIRPILDGGIDYVLKYLDKMVCGSDAVSLYDDNNVERPFHHWSKNLGTNLYFDNLEFIRKNNFCYKIKHGKLRPVPMYYRNKFFGKVVRNLDLETLKARQSHHPFDDTVNNRYSLSKLNEINKRNSEIREKNLRNDMLSSGSPCYLIPSTKLSFSALKNLDKLAVEALDIIPF